MTPCIATRVPGEMIVFHCEVWRTRHTVTDNTNSRVWHSLCTTTLGMTTVALIADVHANALALEAVLRACGDRGVGAIWCAGDLVGYNSMPRETIALVRRKSIATVHGNHDL